MICGDYNCLLEEIDLLIVYCKQIFCSGSRNTIGGIWAKDDQNYDSRAGENLNIVFCLLCGSINLGSTALIKSHRLTSINSLIFSSQSFCFISFHLIFTTTLEGRCHDLIVCGKGMLSSILGCVMT